MTTKRGRLVYSLVDDGPDTWQSDILDIHRAGNKRDGYAYRVVTFSDMHFRETVLTDDQRRAIIAALGGTITEMSE